MNMHSPENPENLPALKVRIRELVAEHDEKKAEVDTLVGQFDLSVKAIEMGATIRGRVADSVWYRGKPDVSADKIRDNLRKSAWLEAFQVAHLDKIAPAADREKFRLAMENPPEFTWDNLVATFGQYIEDPRQHILRGLAECFADLDPFFKSHSKVKVGKKGLPKRIILTNVGRYSDSWGYKRLRDTLNAVRVFEGEPHLSHNELRDLMDWKEEDEPEEWLAHERYQSNARISYAGQRWTTNSTRYPAPEFPEDPEGLNGWRKLAHPMPGIEIKRFANGNAHVHFDKERLIAVNRAIAEFYGDVLPDVQVDPGKPRPSTEVSTKLQFYGTPRAVLAHIWNRLDGLYQTGDILEPSAGEGAIIEFLREMFQAGELHGDAQITAIEVDKHRHAILREKKIHALRANFLEVRPDPRFGLVIMNPPFHGLHWKKHVAHGLKFLRPRDPEARFGSGGAGRLVAILPATAYYDGHLDEFDGKWHDLPVGSFAESGTNVPTGYFTKWG